MISGFQSLSTINSGLILQQLEQDITASDLAEPSLDSQGYLMNSLERVNTGTSSAVSFAGVNGFLNVGTGVSADSITRLRDSFLDGQIRQASTTVGYNEILANTSGSGVLNQINSIINSSSTGTLNYALTQFQSAWQALGANTVPGNDLADRAAVVSAGIAFAQTASSQYNGLQNLQITYNNNIKGTVSQINQLLQQLNSINNQLGTTQGSNQNSLLDARDYALDKLSRLMNFSVTFGNNGTSNVFLNGISLLSSGGAGQLQANIDDPHNPRLVDITVMPPANSYVMQEGGSASTLPPVAATPMDITSLITGGNLGGELQARNVILQSYKQEVNQATTVVMNIANTLQSAGYAADGVTTGTLFFEGTGASNITVNGVLGTNAGLVAESSVAFGTAGAAAYPGAPATGNQQIAQMLGGGSYAGSTIDNPGLMNLMSQNFAATNNVNVIGAPNPYALLDTFLPAGTGSVSINGVTVNYDTTIDSISSLLQNINSQVSGVTAVYNTASQQFFIFSTSPVNIINGAGNPPFADSSNGTPGWTDLENFMVGAATLNNSFTPNQAYAVTWPNTPSPTSPSPLNSTIPIIPPPYPPPPAPPPAPSPNFGPNISAYAVTPAVAGSFLVNGATVSWSENESLSDIIQNAFPNFPPGIDDVVTGVTPQAWENINGLFPTFFGGNGAQVFVMNSTQPMAISDISGNFTDVTGLNANDSLGNLSASILGQITGDLSGQESLTSQAQDSLNQLNTAQANIAGINTGTSSSSSSASGIPTSSTAGVPLASIQQQATQAATVYNALLEIMQVIDNMYANLINIIGGTSTSTSGVFASK